MKKFITILFALMLTFSWVTPLNAGSVSDVDGLGRKLDGSGCC